MRLDVPIWESVKSHLLSLDQSPTRFKFKYNEDYKLCIKLKKAMLTQMKRLYNEKGVCRFYVTGAIGVHMWAGELAL